MGKESTNNGGEKPQLAITVEQLIDVNPYNPDILPDLENYVKEQVLYQTYNLDANLCLLRLYQFEPERMSTSIVARILVKALMAMPAPDFSLCLFLIPERVQMEEQFKTLIVLSHYLETARFHQFWDEAAKSRQIVEDVPGISDCLNLTRPTLFNSRETYFSTKKFKFCGDMLRTLERTLSLRD